MLALAAETLPAMSVAWEPITILGGLLAMQTAIIGRVIYLILTGRLLPKATVDLTVTGLERVIAGLEQRNTFQETSITKMSESDNELVRQNRELLATARLSTALLEAVHPNSAAGGGHASVAPS